MKETKKEKAKIIKKTKPKSAKTADKVTKVKPAKKVIAKPTRKPAIKLSRPKSKIAVKKEKISVAPSSPTPVQTTIAAAIKVAKPPEIPREKLKPPEVIVEEKIKEIKEKPAKVEIEEVAAPPLKELELKLPITVKDLAVRLQEKSSVLIKLLMDMGIMASINQVLEETAVTKIGQHYGFMIKKAAEEEELALSIHAQPDEPHLLEPRPPIVTLMGHVDHGKTSLLDAIRKSKIAEYEHGGITQHIGAYRVVLPHGEITFLDTPGHEAFTAMRARGAKATDMVVLVVAADDGVMPQTQEAIDHARAAGVSIAVAINKIDKPEADTDRVKKQLAELGLTAEDWGGKTITVCVSAKTGQGIDDLLEMILLEAQMLELKANPQRLAKGVVLEGKLVKSKGPVVTLLVQNGTLHLNDNVIIGKYAGKIRAMFDDHGRSVVEAGASFPVEVLGISGVPQAGEQFFVFKDERIVKQLAEKRQEKEKQEQMRPAKRIGLEDLYSQIKEGKLKELKLIFKTDAQGSLEAIKEALHKLNVSEIKIEIIHEGVGSINYSDVILALASEALIIGFNVTPDETAKELIAKEGQEVRLYNIIYELINDIRAALEGMLEPKLKKVFLGRAEIRKVFRLSSFGVVAGCFVTKGKISRNSPVNIVRNEQVIYEGELSSLKRFKDDVREVEEGYECGMTLKGFEAIMEGDIIEAYQIEKIARKLTT